MPIFYFTCEIGFIRQNFICENNFELSDLTLRIRYFNFEIVPPHLRRCPSSETSKALEDFYRIGSEWDYLVTSMISLIMFLLIMIIMIPCDWVPIQIVNKWRYLYVISLLKQMDTAFVFPLFFACTSHLSMNNWRDFSSGNIPLVRAHWSLERW